MTSWRMSRIPYPKSLEAIGDFDRQIVAMFRDGFDYSTIARKLGAHPRTIAGRAAHINTLVPPGQPPVFESNYGRVPIAKTMDAVNHVDRQLLELFSQGLGYLEIGKRLGMPRQTVATRIVRLRDNLGEHIIPRRHAKPAGGHRNTAEQSMPPAAESRSTAEQSRPGDRAGRVRCLGGCDQHFDSPDRCRIRICARCKAKQRENSDGYTEHRLFTA